jgi:hypothetical protein
MQLEYQLHASFPAFSNRRRHPLGDTIGSAVWGVANAPIAPITRSATGLPKEKRCIGSTT